MNGTSTATDFRERLQRKIERDRQTLETVTANELKKLEDGLRNTVNGALSTIERDTGAATKRMAAMLLMAWMRPLLVGLSLFLGILLGSWGLMQWLLSDIESKIETRAELRAGIEEQRETLRQIEEQTWGVEFHEIKNGDRLERLLVLPRGTTGEIISGNVPATKGLKALRLLSE